ncbi:MAG TPA: hypothetical protein VIG30_03885, partial [Ktedonobacterales bacterium]
MEPRQPGADTPPRTRRADTPAEPGQPGWPVNPLTGQPVPRPYSAGVSDPRDPGDSRGPRDPRLGGGGATPNGNGRGRPRARQAPEARPPWEDDDADLTAWEWQLANPSLAGAPLEEMTGTGKFAAVFPLTPGEAVWGKGFSAPKAPKGSRAALAGTAAYPGP